MSTSKLQKQVKQQLFNYFYHYHIEENYRPDWLMYQNGNNLEIDFYIERLSVAIEVQGEQHFIYSPFFHNSYDDFIAQTNRDKFKKNICQEKGIVFIEISSPSQIDRCLEKLLLIENNPKELSHALFDKKLKSMVNALSKSEQCYFNFNGICKTYEEIKPLLKDYKSMHGDTPERRELRILIGRKLSKINSKLIHLKKSKNDNEVSGLAKELWDKLNSTGMFFVFKKFKPKRPDKSESNFFSQLIYK
jgi:hypothetical protein